MCDLTHAFCGYWSGTCFHCTFIAHTMIISITPVVGVVINPYNIRIKEFEPHRIRLPVGGFLPPPSRPPPPVPGASLRRVPSGTPAPDRILCGDQSKKKESWRILFFLIEPHRIRTCDPRLKSIFRGSILTDSGLFSSFPVNLSIIRSYQAKSRRNNKNHCTLHCTLWYNKSGQWLNNNQL